MKIRTKLTLQFLFIGGAIMIIASCAIYFSSSNFRREDFYNRLENKANTTARLLIEVAEIDADLLKRIERDNPVNLPSEMIIIYDYKNDTLFISNENNQIKIEVRDLNRTRLYERITMKQGDYEILGLLYTERFDRFVVIASAIDVDGFKQLKNLRIILVVVFITSLILIFIAGWVYSGRALEPISTVVKQVEDISIASLNLRVDEGNGTDEIAKLAKTFNSMLDRLEEAFKMQKDFISNASHEIRTPLTAVYGQLQVLLMKERSATDYQKAIHSVVEDIRNLTDLSNSLLLLAQTKSETSDKSFTAVRMDELLWQAAEEIKRIHPDYKISIGIDFSYSSGEADEMVVHGNEFLLKVSVSNLMVNGCKYSENHTTDVRMKRTGELISITFSDLGVGIPAGDMDKIFEPFHRGANVKAISGHGIGLSLVKGIIKNHNGTIQITSFPGEGTEVIVRIPVM